VIKLGGAGGVWGLKEAVGAQTRGSRRSMVIEGAYRCSSSMKQEEYGH